MPIQVKTQRLTPWHNDMADEIKVNMLNEVAEEFACEVREELSTLTCKCHPHKNSYITVIADRAQTTIVRTEFCCPDFGRQVSVKIER
jgi:hypothetical protein